MRQDRECPPAVENLGRTWERSRRRAQKTESKVKRGRKKWQKKKESKGKRSEKKKAGPERWMASARNDGEKDGARDDRVLTSEGRQSLHITQLSWKINSLRSGQWCQQRAGRPAPKNLLPSISIGISPAHPEHGQSGPGSSSLTMSLHYYFLFFVLSNHGIIRLTAVTETI